jgi:two-component system, OmpR family, sensor histidine kinase KdpD
MFPSSEVQNPGPFQAAKRLSFRLAVVLAFVALITVTFVQLIHVNATTVGFVYLLGVLLVATAWGLLESTIASVVSMLCFNFFFFPPVGTFTVADPQNWVAIFALLATSLIASQLSARAKRRTKEALSRQLEIERLYALSRALLLINPREPVAKQIPHQIAQIFDLSAIALYDRQSGEIHRAGRDVIPNVDSKLKDAVARSRLLQDEISKLTITPIRLGGEPIGSLAFRGELLSDAALQSLLNLVAIGLEKVRAQEAVNRAEVARQSEELKSTLLDAIAHDFKTPLTSIKAVTTDLLDAADGLAPQQRELVRIADEGAVRLERLVTEAIQLARIEGGASSVLTKRYTSRVL